jgi:hypothetical protein
MINEYVNKLIENLPDEIKNRTVPEEIDLVLDGGVFNGSYHVGALYFLKEMERRKYIKINRISGCSVGSIVAFLYFIDGLELMAKLYDIISNEFKNKMQLSCLKEIKNHIEERIPKDILEKVNDKLFISYNNIKTGEKKVKSSYKSVDDIINTVIKSSFVPYLIDGNLLYENKYIDGIVPFMFEERKNKILYLDLYGIDKVGYLFNVKNEKTNFHRVLSGLLDIHGFYIKQCNTSMCSYVNDWNYGNIGFNNLKLLFEKVCICIIHLIIYIKSKVSEEFKENIAYKIMAKVSYDIFVIILENYCL